MAIPSPLTCCNDRGIPYFQEVIATLQSDKQPIKSVRGIGFDATCSLVALNSSGAPVTVSPSKEPHRNIIMWLDHRAIKQAQSISDIKHKVIIITFMLMNDLQI